MAAAPAPRVTVVFLLLSKDGLNVLVELAKAISANSVILGGNERYVAREHELPEERQIALLGAAGISAQPVLCYAIQG